MLSSSETLATYKYGSLLDLTLDHRFVQSCRKYCSYKSSTDRVADGTTSFVHLFTGNLVDLQLRESNDHRTIVLPSSLVSPSRNGTMIGSTAAVEPNFSLPHTSTKGSGQGCPSLRASNDHHTMIPPSLLVISSGMGAD